MPTFLPVDDDPFAPAPGASPPGGGTLRLGAPDGPGAAASGSLGPAGGGPRLVPVDDDPFAEGAGAKPSIAADVAKAIPSKLAQGAMNLAGLPADAMNLVDRGWQNAMAFLLEKTGALTPEQARGIKQPMAGIDGPDETRMRGIFPTSGLLKEGTDAALRKAGLPEMYKPQTIPGEYAGAVAEFLPGAGTSPANIAKFAVAPALASETAGQLTKGSAIEPVARLAGGLAAGVGAAAAGRPSAAERIFDRAAGEISPREFDQVQGLMQDAIARGVSLTWPEAVQQVVGPNRLGDVMRVIEGKGGLASFFAQRPSQVEAAGRRALDTIAPPNPNPTGIGPAVGRAAEQEIKDTQATINAATRPAYDAASSARVGPEVHAGLMSDPLYARTLEQVRADPALNRTIAALPDDSVGVVDLVQRRLREQAEGARSPGQATTSNLAAANLEDARTAPIAAAETATGSRAATETAPAVQGAYESARAAQEHLRNRYLQPLLDGPLGKIAGRSDTQAAIRALFPRGEEALANGAGEISAAMATLSRRTPRAAADLTRAYAEGVFNNAITRLQSGPNQFGGAKFAAALRGNPQEAENLSAAIGALPNGEAINAGFSRFLDIMEATGQRQAQGSKTTFNTELSRDLTDGGALKATAGAAATGGFNIPKRMMDAFDNWQAGRNVDRLAALMTSPEGGRRLAQLATAPPGASTMALLNRLVGIASHGAQPEAQEPLRFTASPKR